MTNLNALLETAEAKALAPDVLAAVTRALGNRAAEPVTWPTSYRGKHLEPGLVRYNMRDPKTGATRDITFLLPKDTIDRMRQSIVGKPIVNEVHKKVNPSWFKDGMADGVVVGGDFDGASGWEHVNFLVWDEDTKRNCANGYELSCAYVPSDINWTAGLHHNIPYDGVILNGDYTHVAVVPDPRYRGATIEAVHNSIGGFMFKLLFGDKTVELDKAATISLDGKPVALAELVNAHVAAETAKAVVTATKEAAAALENDASVLEVNGQKVTVGALKAAFKDQEARNAATAQAKADKEAAEKVAADKLAKDKADEEARNAVGKCEHGAVKADCTTCKAGEQHHQALKNAAEQRGGVVKAPAHRNDAEKEAEGARKYGGPRTAAKA